jgi:hypothetical protein
LSGHGFKRPLFSNRPPYFPTRTFWARAIFQHATLFSNTHVWARAIFQHASSTFQHARFGHQLFPNKHILFSNTRALGPSYFPTRHRYFSTWLFRPPANFQHRQYISQHARFGPKQFPNTPPLFSNRPVSVTSSNRRILFFNTPNEPWTRPFEHHPKCRVHGPPPAANKYQKQPSRDETRAQNGPILVNIPTGMPPRARRFKPSKTTKP